GFAGPQAQHRAGLARAELVDERASAGGLDRVGDVAHLEPDLDADVVLEINQGLDLQLQTHVEVAHRLGDEAPRHRGSRGDHGDAVADVDLRLFLVLHADAGIGEQVGPAVGLPE